jgi:hypothetical protein
MVREMRPGRCGTHGFPVRLGCAGAHPSRASRGSVPRAIRAYGTRAHAFTQSRASSPSVGRPCHPWSDSIFPVP